MDSQNQNIFQKIWDVVKEWPKKFSFWAAVIPYFSAISSYIWKKAWISSIGNYFLKILDLPNPNSLIVGSIVIFTLAFLLSLISILGFLIYSRNGISKKLEIESEETIRLTREKDELDGILNNKISILERELSYERHNLKILELEYNNLKFIEEIIIDRLGHDYQNRKEFLKSHLPKYVTVFPIRYDYLIEIGGKYTMLVLSAKTTITIKDEEGKSAELVKEMRILPLTKEHKEIGYKYFFDSNPPPPNIVVDKKKITGRMISTLDIIRKSGGKKRFQYIRNEKKLSAFKEHTSELSMTVNDCFLGNEEYWESTNAGYPVLYESLVINTVKEIKKHKCLIWDYEEKKWIPTNQNQAISVKPLLKNGAYGCSYYLNYQDTLIKNKSKSQKFRIVWSY